MRDGGHRAPPTDGVPDGTRSPWRVGARRLVVAMPPAVHGRIAFDPPLPGARDQLAQRAPMGSVTKVHAVYDRPFWRDAGLSGQVVADSGLLRATFDDSPEDGSHGVLMGFIAGPADRASEAGGPEGRREACLGELARAFGSEAARPVEFAEQRWSAEPFTRGGPVACLGPGVLTGCGPSLREPVGPIHWAGTETASVWSRLHRGRARVRRAGGDRGRHALGVGGGGDDVAARGSDRG